MWPRFPIPIRSVSLVYCYIAKGVNGVGGLPHMVIYNSVAVKPLARPHHGHTKPSVPYGYQPQMHCYESLPFSLLAQNARGINVSRMKTSSRITVQNKTQKKSESQNNRRPLCFFPSLCNSTFHCVFLLQVQDVSRLLFGRCQTVITNSFQAPPHQKTTSTDSNSDSDPFMPSRMCVINRHNKKWMFLVTWTLKNPIEILAAPSTLIVDRGQNTKPGGAVYANDWVFQKSPTISANLGQSSIYMQINQHEIHYNRQDLEKSRLNIHWNNYFS